MPETSCWLRPKATSRSTCRIALVKDWIRRFCRLQSSPLAAVISVSAGRQLLFVQQHASEPINRVLDAWGLDKGAAERKAYPHLGPVALEASPSGSEAWSAEPGTL